MMETQPIPDAIRAQLSAGEQVLWCGQPRQGLMLRPVDVFAVPFSLLVSGLVVYAEWNMFQQWKVVAMAPPPDTMFMVVVVGLYLVYLLVGRFFYDAWQRARTHYALTSQRVLLVGGLRRGRVQSVALQSLSDDLSLWAVGRNGYGTVLLFTHLLGKWRGGLFFMPGLPGKESAKKPRLDTIANARHVCQMIRDAQRRFWSELAPLNANGAQR